MSDLNLHGTTDAAIWAKEFCRLFPDANEGLMLGWFANAILAGVDSVHRTPAWQDISTAPKDALQALSKIIRDCIYENGTSEKTLTLPDGSVHSGPVVDWVHDTLSVIADIAEKALNEPTAQTEKKHGFHENHGETIDE